MFSLVIWVEGGRGSRGEEGGEGLYFFFFLLHVELRARSVKGGKRGRGRRRRRRREGGGGRLWLCYYSSRLELKGLAGGADLVGGYDGIISSFYSEF